ncbi:omptin family outer membrane protease [Xenorhabdus ishibashii]|uniref:Plasminogen activator n=1 Tax=Xenorhabdus ishibashii TaxID=1034471 RepID=A0A2D0KC82_9GAMM|nr:omptin family outer membrane protease [Xenorhabdus ishibashii]PHM60962.1 plasminogen activator [Xenorhabdus ishibashii]
MKKILIATSLLTFSFGIMATPALSQLDWKIGDALIARGKVFWTPLDSLTVNADGWARLSSSDSKMVDDLNAAGWLIKQSNYKLGAVLGYQETRFSWTAYGDHYIYDNSANIGEFSTGMVGVGYKQKYSVPYIGLSGQYRYQDFEFNFLLKYSPWVKAWGNDEHYMRRLTLPQRSDNVHYFDASIEAGYYLTQNTKVYTAFIWNKYREGKGKTKFTYYDADYTKDLGDDSIGIENRNYSLDLGLQYHF